MVQNQIVVAESRPRRASVSRQLLVLATVLSVAAFPGLDCTRTATQDTHPTTILHPVQEGIGYDLSKVPDITKVGTTPYMQWFLDNATSDKTRHYVERHRPALEQTLTSLKQQTTDMAVYSLSARRDKRHPDRPGLKEPHKVEEKIYRMILESEADWKSYDAGIRPEGGFFPRGITPARARHQVLEADPRVPEALRDVAGIRVVLHSLEDVRTLEQQLRLSYGNQVIRFKDYLGDQYRNDGYRSVHFVVLVDDIPVEIQIRTTAQHKWAKWEHHLIYKGPFKDDVGIKKYALDVADRLYLRDQGNCAPPCSLPECPKKLRHIKRCYLE
jgi:hypothetical protein